MSKSPLHVDFVAQGVHYASEQGLSASRLCCGSVSLSVRKDDTTVELHIDRKTWAEIAERLGRI